MTDKLEDIKKYIGDKLSLLTACENNESVNFIKKLLTAYPEAAHEKDSLGILPLHKACNFGYPKELIELIYKCNPGAIKEECHNGLPLITALSGGYCSIETLEFLHSQYTDAINQVNRRINIIMYDLVTKELDNSLAYLAFIFKIKPDLLCQEFKDGRDKSNLFFLALKYKRPIEVIELLLHAHPEAARKEDSNNNFPLHIACANNATPEVIKLLLQAYPEAAFKQNYWGKIPIQYVFEKNAPIEVIKLLLQAYPDEFFTELHPLHMACENNYPIEFIKFLLERYPEAIKIKFNDSLPLTLAIINGALIEVIELLFQAYPEAINEKNCGMLPFHFCCKFKSSFEVTQLIYNKYPEAIRIKDDYGKLALHYACSYYWHKPYDGLKINKNEDRIKYPIVEVIELLFNIYPAAAKKKDNEGYLPLHYICISFRDFTDKFIDFTDKLITFYPKSINKEVKDRNRVYTTPLLNICENTHMVPDIIYLLLARGANYWVKNNFNEDAVYNIELNQKNSHHCACVCKPEDARLVIKILKRWPVLMTIIMLKELKVFNLGSINMAMIDVAEYMGIK